MFRESGSIVDDTEAFESARDYFNTNPIPHEILNEIRAGYHQESKAIRFVLNEGLFTDLYMFAVARLRVYYDDFKNNSQAFQ